MTRALALLAVALAVVCGCSASLSWTIGAGETGGAATKASSEHLDVDAIKALGEAAGNTAGAVVRGAVP